MVDADFCDVNDDVAFFLFSLAFLLFSSIIARCASVNPLSNPMPDLLLLFDVALLISIFCMLFPPLPTCSMALAVVPLLLLVIGCHTSIIVDYLLSPPHTHALFGRSSNF